MSQVEFALTQVVDRPVQGRIFFEEVLRENLDLGRPDNLQLIFERRVTKRTPGSFRTRVVREGVIPSLHVDYKSRPHEAVLQGRPCVADGADRERRRGTSDLVGSLGNLPALRKLGFSNQPTRVGRPERPARTSRCPRNCSAK